MSEGDDDWFESAFEEDGDHAAGSADADSPSPEQPFEDENDSDTDETNPLDSESDDRDDDAGTLFEKSGSDSPFEDSASGTVDDAVDGGGAASEESDSPFEGSGSDSPFEDSGDDGGDDGGSSLFGDDFATAFESAGGPGGGSGGDDGEFEDEDFDSDIPRIDIGIQGLDRMIQGGIPRRHLIVSIGSAGTGKTTFGLQFLHHGLENGENCVFITLEQSHSAIMDTANDRGWGFDEYEAENKLAVVDLDPVEMANSLDNIRGELPGLIEDFDADRLVLDSVSLLEMMYDNPAKRRTEVFDFTRSLKDAGVTTMVTSEANETNPYASRHGIIEYLTDAVFILQYVRGDTQETRLAVEIEKVRNANHSRQTKPYAITLDGIDVYQQASIF